MKSCLTAEEAMEKAVDYVKGELRGVRTGRASTALVEFIKVEATTAGESTCASLAVLSVPEATQILIKPFDASSLKDHRQGRSRPRGWASTRSSEGKQIRLNMPPLSGERRTQLVGSVKQMGEQAKVSVRNARRDANKHIEQAAKDKSNAISEDQAESAKSEVQDLLKKYEAQVDELVGQKTEEIQQV